MRFGCLTVLIILGYILTQHYHDSEPTLSPEALLPVAEPCAGYEYATNIVVSVKTGATEAQERIPTLLRTSLRCISNTILFSDLEQDIEAHHLVDVLDAVSPEVVSTNPDFKFYTHQKELWKTLDVSSLKEMATSADKSNIAAWKLDKYKFLHLVEKTWKIRPDKDWYIIVDADTYVHWPNMLHWLRGLDPSKKAYLGAEVSINGVRFAHGGTGIILSWEAMYELVIVGNGTANGWDDRTIDKCCGDLVLGMALKEHGLNLQEVWPFMSGETPFTMPFGPGTPEYWCGPVISLHHLAPAEMLEFDRFEKQRQDNSVSPCNLAADTMKLILHVTATIDAC